MSDIACYHFIFDGGGLADTKISKKNYFIIFKFFIIGGWQSRAINI